MHLHVEQSFGKAYRSFESLGTAFAASAYDPATEVPAAYIRVVESGEFFELSKLLPKNQHIMQVEFDENEFHCLLGKIQS